MKKAKRGISWMLIAALCLATVLPHVRTVLASENRNESNADAAEDAGYTVTLEDIEHGTVKFTDTEEKSRKYQKGDTVSLQAFANEGYQLGEISVLNAESEEEVCLAEQTEEGLFSFVMPDYNLIVKAAYMQMTEEGLSDSMLSVASTGYTAARSSGTSSQLRVGIGRIRVYSDSNALLKTYNEGMLGVNGTVAFCLNPLVYFKAGSVTGIDLLEYGLSQTEITVCAMIIKYAYEYSELTENQQYLVAQCLIWRYLNSRFGWNCGNVHIDESDLNVTRQGEIYVEIMNNVSENMNKYIGEGTAYISESAQPLAQFSLKPAYGYAQLIKASGNTSLTENNACYSLEGAKYGVYKDSDCSQLMTTLTTDAKGNTNIVSLEPGAYYVKEIEASKGFILDPDIYPVQVTASETAVVQVSDEPVNGLPEIEIYKIDKETKSVSVQGAASLENAQFRVNFYEGYYTEENLPNTAAKTWILKTKSTISGDGTISYVVKLGDTYKVSGDSFYKVGDDIILPLGTISIEEIQAPVGYSLTGSAIQAAGDTDKTEGMYVAQIRPEEESAILTSGNEFTVADRVIRGDFELTKIDNNTQNPMEGVTFRITSNTTGESHTFTTDANGHYSSRSDYTAHSNNTNGGNVGDGLWFGLDANGENVEVDDEVGALPYDTYTIEELECAVNKGKSLYTGTISIVKDNYLVTLGNIENSDVTIKTTAKDEVTGTHYAMADSDVTIIDTVEYTGLIKNQTYMLKGTLMNRNTGEPVADGDGNPITVTKKITPKDSNGEVEVEFFFDASGLQGLDVVVFEELYLDNKQIAEHTDMNEDSQTIHFPAIGTEASDSETNCEITKADEEITIIDTVSYENLREGRKYTIKGTLMDKETGRAVLDENGNKIEAETTFTAKTTNGTVEVIFRFNGSNLGGKTLVAFETLEKDNHEYAVHKDLQDEEQTIYLPKIETTVSDSDTGVHVSRADQEVTMIDKVQYENLVPGREYTLEGILINRETGKTVMDIEGNKITARTVFIPEKKNGTTEVTFRFNGEELDGETLVVYEELLYNGKSIAEHKAIDDEEQTIYLPGISTKAADKEIGEQISYADTSVAIEDTVSYENLICGQKYVMKGVLKYQATGEPVLNKDGEEISAETEFTAKRTQGEVTVTFEFDGSHLAGKTVVVCEELFMNQKSVAVHADLEDTEQMIEFPEITTKVTDQKTGMNLSNAEEEIVVTDTVSYWNLLVDRQYSLNGVLVDKETGEPALDADGEEIRADITFVPEKADGTITLDFKFNGKGLENHTFVVFEELTMKKSWFRKVTVAIHKDMNDENQSVYIPMIATTAADQETKVHLSKADEEMTIIDTVKYQNLIAGLQYEAKGTLINQKTGKPILDDYGKEITSALSFVPEKSDGTIRIPFEFSGNCLSGETAVVYEDLYYNQILIASHRDAKEEKQTIYIPKIITKALDSETKDHASMADCEVTIIDTVSYTNLLKGQEYVMKGVLIDQSTGEQAVDVNGKEITAEKTFIADGTEGSVEVMFIFNGTGMDPGTLVSYEELFLNEISIAEHTDLNDEEQSIHIPNLVTKIVDSETMLNLSEADDSIHAIDTVRMKNLLVGRKYVLEGYFLDSSGQMVRDAEGNEISAKTFFTAESDIVAQDVEFRFKGSSLDGQTLLTSVKLYMENEDGTLVMVAEDDINNSDEHLHIPKITTTALDFKTLEHIAKAEETVKIQDTIAYENLLPGYQYEVKGMLVDKETKEQALDADGRAIVASVLFTAESSDGTVETVFEFCGGDMAGKTLVAYEELYLNGVRVANHADAEDAGQSIYFPLLNTNAVNKADGDKSIMSQGTVTITDKVEYKNLVPGREYKVSGIIMDKVTGEPFLANGATVTAESVFVADASSGYIENEFTFNADDLGDRELVVFEKLFIKDAEKEMEIAEHEDLEDCDQTVTFRKPQIELPEETVKTGDDGWRQMSIYISLLMAAIIIIIILFRGKTHK